MKNRSKLTDIRKIIYRIIEPGQGGKSGWVYDALMLCAIVASIIPLTYTRDYPVFEIIEIVTVTIFVADYLLRWLTADFRLKKGGWSFALYPFTGWAIIDLLSILPGLHVLTGSFKLLRLSRMLRLLRILRVFKLIRYTNKIEVLLRVIRKEKDVLLTVLGIAIFYVFVTALVMFNMEPHFNPATGAETFGSFFDALYWATVTLTTVGYGDMIPVTDVGRFISMLSSLFGVAIIALPSGVITASYMDELRSARKREEREKEELEQEQNQKQEQDARQA